MTTLQTVNRIPTPALHPILGWRGMILGFARESVGFLSGLQQQYGFREFHKLVMLGDW